MNSDFVSAVEKLYWITRTLDDDRFREIPVPEATSLHELLRAVVSAAPSVLKLPDFRPEWPIDDDTTMMLMSKMPLRTLANFSLVCHRFAKLANNSAIYSAILERDFPLFCPQPLLTWNGEPLPAKPFLGQILNGAATTALVQLYEIEGMSGTLMSCSAGYATVSGTTGLYTFDTLTGRHEENCQPNRLRPVPAALVGYLARALRVERHELVLHCDPGHEAPNPPPTEHVSFYDDLNAFAAQRARGLAPGEQPIFTIGQWIELQWAHSTTAMAFTWWGGLVREVTEDGGIWIEFPQFPKTNAWRWIWVPLAGAGYIGGIRVIDAAAQQEWIARLPHAASVLGGAKG
ncbi:hypothetical protein PAPYR_6359 [Paratrimastix pyriformis]|uniref:F-box domain-containing protein n=1 Tax=Paratrimastix pyriformis TaxID=342808 RepID=A0ABQ8UJT2_9EUKA|nr:hypothetical protein PAPYR_6359 [Paratrimastix pyriformis]